MENLVRGHRCEEMHESGNRAGPTGLVIGAKAGAVVAVEVLVELQIIAPVWITLELLTAAIDGASAILAFQKHVRETTRDLFGNLIQVHVPAGTGWTFDGEIVAVVVVVLQER